MQNVTGETRYIVDLKFEDYNISNLMGCKIAYIKAVKVVFRIVQKEFIELKNDGQKVILDFCEV